MDHGRLNCVHRGEIADWEKKKKKRERKEMAGEVNLEDFCLPGGINMCPLTCWEA